MTGADTPSPQQAPETSACPGCGAVLAVVPGLAGTHAGASASCAGLFAVTVRGLREEAGQDVQAASLLRVAADAYEAQHLLPGAPAAAPVRLCLELERSVDHARSAALGSRVDDAAPRDLTAPERWTTTVADLAADLDVVDLPALVRAWADAVWTDWTPAHDRLRAAADTALTG
ncbi:DUF5946 family protein [Modestobacter sp. VKM Ac-2977]|uniref:DUF5946 family protein n=1 Tax=Modestobacter sp. VKM Ac-2977 TaxID=3004131 RepID=UPI0022AAB587|nr:DUF5946 family protein [Modestobacter sp. VKM Ac-2977]MCZ2822730.1 DUF5946 family protein [Modestobacter sp. VKM Ac-2977]